MWNKFPAISPLPYVLTGIILLSALQPLLAQKRPESYFGGKLQVYALKEAGSTFKIFDLRVESVGFQAVYFGQDAKARFKAWQKRNRKQVVCQLAVGFARDWEPQQPPLGMSVEQGRIINRNIDGDMDGLVLLSSHGQLTALDLEHERANGRFHLRNSTDRSRFLQHLQRESASAFQTQLMYSHVHGYMMGEDKHGKRAARRFLAICTDSRGATHHLILDLVASTYLNLAAKRALALLQKRGFEVQYLLNQDTGSRNIMEAFDEKGKRLYAAPVPVSQATQLLVYVLP